MLDQTVQVPVIGVWGADYRVTGLELGMSNNFITEWSINIHLYSAVLRTETFFAKNFAEGMYHNLIREKRYYLFKNTNAEDLTTIVGKQAYASCEGGTYIGFIGNHKGHYYLFNFFGKIIKSAGCVKQASAIEWTRQI